MGSQEAEQEPDQVGLGHRVGSRAAVPLPHQPSPLDPLGHGCPHTHPRQHPPCHPHHPYCRHPAPAHPRGRGWYMGTWRLAWSVDGRQDFKDALVVVRTKACNVRAGGRCAARQSGAAEVNEVLSVGGIGHDPRAGAWRLGQGTRYVGKPRPSRCVAVRSWRWCDKPPNSDRGSVARELQAASRVLARAQAAPKDGDKCAP